MSNRNTIFKALLTLNMAVQVAFSFLSKSPSISSSLRLGLGRDFNFLTTTSCGTIAKTTSANTIQCLLMSSSSSSSSSSGSSGGRGSAAVSQQKDPTKKQQQSNNRKQDKLDLNPPRGTRDFYPEDMRLRSWLFDRWHAVARSHGFSEYDAPVLESEALYVRKAGEEVTEQLYNFEDKGRRRVALRPEMTPSLARMVMAKRKGLNLPLKWYAIPQCWRYERTTRGRRREHYQWNMDIWGEPGVVAEAELLSAVVAFFEGVGLTARDVGIKVNSRAVLGAALEGLGVPAALFPAVCVVIDKLDKIGPEKVLEELTHTSSHSSADRDSDATTTTTTDSEEDGKGDGDGDGGIGLDMDIARAILGLLEIQSVEEMEKWAEQITNRANTNTAEPAAAAAAAATSQAEAATSLTAAIADVRLLFDLARRYGYVDFLQFDAGVVRGLAYYTGVVFEAFDREGELRAICGGGRYDTLLQTFGAKDGEAIPAVGFGFGDAVIVELLKDRGLLPPTDRPSLDAMVFVLDVGNSKKPQEQQEQDRKDGKDGKDGKEKDKKGGGSGLIGTAVEVATAIRRSGAVDATSGGGSGGDGGGAVAAGMPRVELVLEPKKAKWAFKQADKLDIPFVVLIAPDEAARGEVSIKHLPSKQQFTVPVQQVGQWFAAFDGTTTTRGDEGDEGALE